MLHLLKRLIPAPLLQAYHYTLARLAAFWYGHPSRRLIVIGVTGTNGKTTTSYLLAKALEASGYKTGCTSTAVMKIGEKEWLNKTKMTMPGRFFLQRMLRQMVDDGCRYAVIETSSQGLIQHRQVGIDYDIAVFTNLTPEHVEAHGGFENYKRAKRLLFECLSKTPVKIFDGVTIEKTAVVNADSPHGSFYAEAKGVSHVAWYGIDVKRGLSAERIELTDRGSRFFVNGVDVHLQLPGRYNVENALAVLATCQTLGVDLKAAADELQAVLVVPGRFERVEAGQPWTVIIDYAPEPESLRRLYETIALVPHKRLIHILGSCGGGRDVARRPILGRMAGQEADIVIVTNEDPYDDDPEEIIRGVAGGAEEAGKKKGETLFTITDRKEAIAKAMSFAKEGDLVLMTGKGCEPWMCLEKGRKIPWDEEAAAREGIKSVLQSH